MDKVYDALVSIEKLGKITEAETETGGSLVLDNHQKGIAIEFKNTCFTYPDGNKILAEVNFVIAAGQLVHIYGASGAGKSTILRLLTGTYKKFEGIVLMNGQSVSNYTLDSLRGTTAVLFNNQDIFQGTLWENITMGNVHITLNEVSNFIVKLGLADFVQSDQQGLDMMLDPVGKRLSKRTKQKILLIRALVGNHRLLLLEEPFEYLDKASADTLLAWLKSLHNTTILIASADELLSKECDVVISL